MKMRIFLAPAIVLLSGCSWFDSKPSYTPTPEMQFHAAPMAPAIDSYATPGDISDIQGRLRDAGFYHGPIDGKWGKGSDAAMRAYQVDRHIEVTGKMNPETHSLLYP